MTRMRNHDVQRVLEALLEVWTEALASGERIEIQNFLILELHVIQRKGDLGTLFSNGKLMKIPSVRREVKARASKYLRRRMRQRHGHLL
jgi:nucleoid DNA-binding protein